MWRDWPNQLCWFCLPHFIMYSKYYLFVVLSKSMRLLDHLASWIIGFWNPNQKALALLNLMCVCLPHLEPLQNSGTLPFHLLATHGLCYTDTSGRKREGIGSVTGKLVTKNWSSLLIMDITYMYKTKVLDHNVHVEVFLLFLWWTLPSDISSPDSHPGHTPIAYLIMLCILST